MSDQRHPIQVVARRTGLSADVLRAWEKRYDAVTPERTATGRRVYSDADIDRLRLLKRLTVGGRSIGQIAALPSADLVALVREDASEAARAAPAPGSAPSLGLAAPTVARALAAVKALDGEALDSVLARAVVALRAPEMIDQVAVPLLEQVGAEWQAGRLGVAEEHLASGVLRRVLGQLLSSSAPASAPRLVAATLQGERHEFGALLAAASAVATGWPVTYLGADLPANDIAAAARHQDARAVALSIVCPTTGADIAREVAALTDALPKEMTLVVGGRAAARYHAALADAGAVHLADFAALRAYLASVEPL